MKWSELEQSKYSMEQIFSVQKSNSDIIGLTYKFHNRIVELLTEKNLDFHARTHIRGISFMYNERKSFMPIDIRQQHINVYFWTGDKTINGLKKGSWGSGKPEWTGSEAIKIRTIYDLDKVLAFVIPSYELAKEWFNLYMRNAYR